MGSGYDTGLRRSAVNKKKRWVEKTDPCEIIRHE